MTNTIDFLILFYFSYAITFLHVFISFTGNWCHFDPRTTVKTSMTLLNFHTSSCEQCWSLVDALADKMWCNIRNEGLWCFFFFPQFFLGLKKLETGMRKQHFNFLSQCQHIHVLFQTSFITNTTCTIVNCFRDLW